MEKEIGAPRHYHIEEYNDGPLKTYVVFLDTTEPDAENDEHEGEVINEFYTREEAEACIQALIVGLS
ncbi:hypothetical protein QTH87_13505 [Variovorax sp. J22P168]|nr:hypothetical protein [Variovorax sp. J22P168]